MRRVHVRQIAVGEVELDAAEAHHIRDVLRVGEGGHVEVFDDAGRSAEGVICLCTAGRVVVRVDVVEGPAAAALLWVIASAVPKGPRADWMVEKLSELGAAAFIPLAAERSVVLPEGKGKHGRWSRIAAEAAKQSRRSGVMRVDEMVTVDRLLADLSGPAWYFSTRTGAVSLAEAVRRLGQESAPHAGRLNRGLGEGMRLTLLIGPEGGWTDGEVARFENAGLTAVSLGRTILRIETAAVAAAALAAAVVTPAIEAGAP